MNECWFPAVVTSTGLRTVAMGQEEVFEDMLVAWLDGDDSHQKVHSSHVRFNENSILCGHPRILPLHDTAGSCTAAEPSTTAEFPASDISGLSSGASLPQLLLLVLGHGEASRTGFLLSNLIKLGRDLKSQFQLSCVVFSYRTADELPLDLPGCKIRREKGMFLEYVKRVPPDILQNSDYVAVLLDDVTLDSEQPTNVATLLSLMKEHRLDVASPALTGVQSQWLTMAPSSRCGPGCIGRFTTYIDYQFATFTNQAFKILQDLVEPKIERCYYWDMVYWSYFTHAVGRAPRMGIIDTMFVHWGTEAAHTGNLCHDGPDNGLVTDRLSDSGVSPPNAVWSNTCMCSGESVSIVVPAGLNHFDSVGLRMFFVFFESLKGNVLNAVSMLQAAVAEYEEPLGKGHPSLAALRVDLAAQSLNAELPSFSEALNAAVRVFEDMFDNAEDGVALDEIYANGPSTLFGKGWTLDVRKSRTLRWFLALVDLLEFVQEFSMAEQLVHRALSRQQLFTDSSQEAISAQIFEAVSHRVQLQADGQLEAASQKTAALLTLLSKMRASTHRHDLGVTLKNIGIGMYKAGNTTAALAFLEESHSVLKIDEGHVHLRLDCMREIASMLLERGRPDDVVRAEAIYHKIGDQQVTA